MCNRHQKWPESGEIPHIWRSRVVQKGECFLYLGTELQQQRSYARTHAPGPQPNYQLFTTPSLSVVSAASATLLALFSRRDRHHHQREGGNCGLIGPLPRVTPESRVVQRVEAVIVGDHDIGVPLQEEGEHVVPLFRYGVVEWGVALRVLRRREKANMGLDVGNNPYM